MRRALRFLRAVDGMPAWLLIISLIVGAYGLVLTWMDARSADNALGMLLFWQMLAASRGFARPASAGHYDPILVSASRASLAGAHAVLAVSVVAVFWIATGVVEAIRGTMHPLAFEPARASAFAFVSITSWALSLPGPRLVVGSLWLVLIVLAATTRMGLEQYAAFLSAPDGLARTVRGVLFAWLCPFVMFEPTLPARPVLITAMLIGTLANGAAGVLYIKRRNYPLEPAL